MWFNSTEKVAKVIKGYSYKRNGKTIRVKRHERMVASKPAPSNPPTQRKAATVPATKPSPVKRRRYNPRTDVKMNVRRVEVSPGEIAVYTKHDMLLAIDSVNTYLEQGDERSAIRLKRYVEMIRSVLDGGKYYYTGD